MAEAPEKSPRKGGRSISGLSRQKREKFSDAFMEEEGRPSSCMDLQADEDEDDSLQKEPARPTSDISIPLGRQPSGKSTKRKSITETSTKGRRKSLSTQPSNDNVSHTIDSPQSQSTTARPVSPNNIGTKAPAEDKAPGTFRSRFTSYLSKGIEKESKPLEISGPSSFRENAEAKKQVEDFASRVAANTANHEPEEDALSFKASLTVIEGEKVEKREEQTVFKDLDDLKFMPEDLEDGRPYPRIKAASLAKLVDFVTHEVYADPILKKTFLITYRSFTEPAELLKQLMQRFGLDFGGKPPGEEGDKISGAATPPLPSSEEEAEKVLQKRRIKVVGVLKSWLEYYFYDFGLDKDLMDMLESFLQDICVIMKGAGPHLKKMLDRGISRATTLGQLSSDSHLSRSSINGDPIDWLWKVPTADDIAEQITLLESEHYCAITSRECIAWLKKNKEQNAPTISKMVAFFNQVSWSVTTALVREIRKEERVRILIKMIDVMNALFKLNNFNGVFEILSGLNNSSVRRLKETFNALPKEYLESFENMEKFLSHQKSFTVYRSHLHQIDPPCVPYVGIYLTDLTFLEDGNPDNVDGLINFLKRTRVAKVIMEIEQYQEPYVKLKVDDKVRSALLAQEPLLEADCYKMSNFAEPKNLEKLLTELITEEEALMKEMHELEDQLAAAKEFNEALKGQSA